MQKIKRINKKYSAEFKICVIMDMRNNNLGYGETVRKYWQGIQRNKIPSTIGRLKNWERIFLEEGEAGLRIERRGRTTKMDNPNIGRPRKLNKQVENDLIAENQELKYRVQYLEAENLYLKKLDALVRAEEQKNGKRR